MPALAREKPPPPIPGFCPAQWWDSSLDGYATRPDKANTTQDKLVAKTSGQLKDLLSHVSTIARWQVGASAPAARSAALCCCH